MIHASGDNISSFQKSSRTGEIVYYEMDYREKVFVFGEEKIKEVGNLIKSKIEELSMKTSWAPNPDDLRQEKVRVPHLLELFLTTLLTNETVPSERVKRLVKSLGQDIIYNITRGNPKTSKHTQLGVFAKSKTGSSLLIKCLNQLGHTISYHEVNSLETSFSEKQFKTSPSIRPTSS